ncbi:N-acetylmuramoyl-L-alanine amidase family protein [Bacillus cereus]|uniref:N-acetylmuramoyl-L-alanine amidase family protein n=1 Tax=Bacillus cereus TaxID=1396 RepID=UPI000BF7FB26|nr:hypothetical protein [Bacillus cereus]PFQ67939.1 hypothetical protein COK18_03645 [Bacillus cereus]
MKKAIGIVLTTAVALLVLIILIPSFAAQEKGVKQTGWQTINNKRYYFNNDGIMQTGLVHISNSKVYLRDDGTAYTEWQVIDRKTYYFNKYGYMVVGWFKDDGKWYHQDRNGMIQTGISIAKEKTGWVENEGSYHHYLNSDGTIQTGWKTIDKKTLLL